MEAVRKEWSFGERLTASRGIVRLLLLLLNVVLALVIWVQWSGTTQAVSPAELPAAQAPPLPLPPSPLRRLSLEQYQELIARPLFWSERRALAEASPVEAAGTNQPLAFVLIGVVTSPQSRHALLGKPGATEVSSVQPGDVVEGWQVETMTENSVTLSRGTERQVITLDEKRTTNR